MRIVLNPKYQHLREYLEHIDEHFAHGRELHRGRNLLRTLQVDGLTLVVKRYGKMPLTNRLATRLYKSPKAKNAYVKSLLLKERSFESPEPVAFVTIRENWLNSQTYFVCLHSNYRYSMKDIDTLDPDFREEVTQSFARYAAQLHRNGFLQRLPQLCTPSGLGGVLRPPRHPLCRSPGCRSGAVHCDDSPRARPLPRSQAPPRLSGSAPPQA